MVSSSHRLRVSGKNLDLGPVLREKAEDGVAETVHKYVTGGFSGHVTVTRDGHGYRTDCVVHLDAGDTFQVTGRAEDAYRSLDRAVERIAKQLRRNKRRRLARVFGADDVAPDADGAPDVGIVEETDAAREPVAASGAMPYASPRPLLAERVGDLPRLALEAAVAQFENQGIDHLVFVNVASGRINLLREGPRGALGWLDLGVAES